MNPFDLDRDNPMDDYIAWIKYYENFFTTYDAIFDNAISHCDNRHHSNVYGYMIVNDNNVKN